MQLTIGVINGKTHTNAIIFRSWVDSFISTLHMQLMIDIIYGKTHTNAIIF
jgi:hypothetical protein